MNPLQCGGLLNGYSRLRAKSCSTKQDMWRSRLRLRQTHLIVRLTGFIRFQYENRHRYIPSLVPLPVDDEFTCVFFVQTGYCDGNVQIRAERIGQFLSDVHAAGSASNPASDSCNTISPKQ